jgi:hypothetical protein
VSTDFDPDAFLSETPSQSGGSSFDPDAFLASDFDPDEFLKEPPPIDTSIEIQEPPNRFMTPQQEEEVRVSMAAAPSIEDLERAVAETKARPFKKTVATGGPTPGFANTFEQSSAVDPGPGAALARGGIDSATAGFGDEILGKMESAFPVLSQTPGEFLEGKPAVPQTYEQARDSNRQLTKDAAETQPEAFYTGMAGAAVAVPGGAIGKGFKGAVATGAAYGALGGLGASESETLGGMAQDTIAGAELGAIGGGVLHGVITGAVKAAPVVVGVVKRGAEKLKQKIATLRGPEIEQLSKEVVEEWLAKKAPPTTFESGSAPKALPPGNSAKALPTDKPSPKALPAGKPLGPPSWVTTAVDPDTGKNVGLSVRISRDGVQSIETLPLDTVADAQKLVEHSKGASLGISSESANKLMTENPEVFAALWEDPILPLKRQERAAKEAAEYAALGGTKVERPSAKPQITPAVPEERVFKDIEYPGAGADADVLVDGNGNVLVREISDDVTQLEEGFVDTAVRGVGPYQQTQRWDIGDQLKVAGRSELGPIGGGSGPPDKAFKGPLTNEVPAAPNFDSLPPGDLEDIKESMKLYRQMQSQKSLGSRILDQILGRHLRGPADMAALKGSLQATSLLQRSTDDIYQAAKEKFGAPLLSDFDKKLIPYFEGRISPADFEAANPQLSAEARQFARNLLAEKEALDKQIAAHGMIPDELIMARESGLLDLYLSRRYMAFMGQKGSWAKKLAQQSQAGRLEEMVQYIHKELKKNHPNIGPSDVMEEVLRILRADKPMDALKISTIGKPFKNLLARKDVPGPIRRGLGELESGMARIAMTLGTQRALVAKLDLLQEIALSPRYSSGVANPATGQMWRLPNHRAMGAARGYYVTEDIYDAVAALPRMEAMTHEFVTEALGFIKGNQVALNGVGPIINNLMGNLHSGVLAGGLDLFRPKKSGQALKTAWKAIRDYQRDPTGRTGMGWLALEARRAGADHFGFGAEEIGSPAAKKFIQELEKVFPDDAPTSYFRALGQINKKLFGKYRELQAKGGAVLDITDRMARLQSYASLREKFLRDVEKKGNNSILVREGLLAAGDERGRQAVAMALRLGKLNPNDPIAKEVITAVTRLAARRVNQSFWNPSFIGPGLDKLRRSAAGVITPFATAAFETARVNAMTLQRLAQEPDLRWRLLASGLLVGGAMGANGLLRQYNGISDEEVDAAYANTPKNRKYYRPGAFALAWRDANGRVQSFNVTNMFDVLRYSVGHEDDALWRRVLANFVGSAVDGGAAGIPYKKALEVSGFLKPEPQLPPQRMSTQGATALMKYLAQSGGMPMMVNNILEAGRKTGIAPEVFGDIGSTEEPLTPGQGIARALGATQVQPIGGEPSQRGVAFERKEENRALKSDLRNTAQSKQSEGQKADRRGKIQDELKRLQESRKAQDQVRFRK